MASLGLPSRSRAAFAGLTSVLVTPFADDGSLDLDGLDRVVDFVLSAGARGVTALGIMGESAYLREEERRAVLTHVARRVGPEAGVTVGIGDDREDVLIERAGMVSAAGARAMVAVPSSGNLTTQLAAIVAAQPDLELVVQHYPLLPHPELTPADLAAAVESAPTVVGVKEECPPTAERIRELRELLPHAALVGGLSALWVGDELAAGADGTMTGFAFPERLVRIVELAERGRWDDVRQAYDALLPAIVFEAQPGVEVVLRKAILFERGILPSPKARAPGKLSESVWAQVRQLVQRFA